MPQKAFFTQASSLSFSVINLQHEAIDPTPLQPRSQLSARFYATTTTARGNGHPYFTEKAANIQLEGCPRPKKGESVSKFRSVMVKKG
jgi:hypothetical protein